MRFLFSVFALVLSITLSSVEGQARERILLFKSDIVVQDNGALLVTETIRVKAEGQSIRRGIYRDFPIRYRENKKYWRHVGFSIKAIQRNGKGEPFRTVRTGDYERIYIGEENVFLRHGVYEYTIKYKTTRQLRFFDDFDELYWNVNGNKWRLTADTVIARITLPEGAEIVQEQAFTGRFGQRNGAYFVSDRTKNSITYETTKPLQRYEGLTVAVAWQKGVVPAPSVFTTWFWSMWDNLGLVLLAFGTTGVVFYYLTAWDKIGRDPESGIVIPLFSPPQDLSPAAVSYIHYRKFRASGGASLPFVAALVSLAVKNKILIKNDGPDLEIERQGSSAQDGGAKGLPEGEEALFRGLIGSRKRIAFTQSNARSVQGARTHFKNAITTEFRNVFFKDNLGAFVIGAVLSVITLAGFFLMLWPSPEMVAIIISTVLGAFGAAVFLSLGLRRLGNVIPGGSSKIAGIFFTILGLFFAIPIITIPVITSALPFWVPIALAVLCIVNVMFFTLLRAPTDLGQKVSEDIEGFKLYLSVAEADRMNMKGAPEVNQTVFERFLPYAIGLGVEKPWSNAFESYMAKVSNVEAHSAYSPTWYSGSRGWSMSDLGAATAGVVAGVSAGMAQATPPSTSGSSGGGGGFSGGGGGGGGGGGW